MNLEEVNFALQFIRCLLSIVEHLLPEHHFLHHQSHLFGLSYIKALIFPTLLLPVPIIFAMGYTKIRKAWDTFSTAGAWSRENDRLAFSGTLRHKVTPTIFRHGVDKAANEAIESAVVGASLIIISFVFFAFCIDNIFPIDMPSSVFVLVCSVGLINITNVKALLRKKDEIQYPLIFNKSWEKKKAVYYQDEMKKIKISSAEMLLMLHESGCRDVYFALGMVQEGLEDIMSQMCRYQSISYVRDVHKRITSCLKHVCSQMETEIKNPADSTLQQRLVDSRQKLEQDFVWNVTSLAINAISAFGFALLPLLTLFPTASPNINASIISVGFLCGNFLWMIEPLFYTKLILNGKKQVSKLKKEN